MSHPLMFLEGNEDLDRVLTGSYDGVLVLLSLGVAVTAAWAALLILDRVTESVDRRTRRAWFAVGVSVLGVGIWDMHFLGMLAFELPVVVTYDLHRTLSSVLPGMLGAAAGLHLLAGRDCSIVRSNVAGAALGVGIGAMHYVGMSAMIAPVEMRYSLPLFLLSILVAYVLATAALCGQVWLAFPMGTPSPETPKWIAWGRGLRRAYGALILGLAVGAMHYTGMAAAVYLPVAAVEGMNSVGTGVRAEPLAWLVTIGTGIVLCAAVFSVLVDRRMQEISHELRESERRTRMIVENMAEGIVSMDADGIVRSLNAGASRILGHRPEEVLGRPIDHLIPAFADGAFASRLLSQDREDSTTAVELDARHATKGRVPISLTLVEYTLCDQRTITGVFRDLSEERKLQSQLQQTRKMEAIGQLASGIAHEINTPTQFVTDNVGFLSDGFGDLGRAVEALGELLVATRAAGVLPEVTESLTATLEELEIDYLQREIPRAIDQSRQGLERISSIVGAMKSFARPATEASRLFDLNRAVQNAVMIGRNEWEPVAEIELDVDESLPPIPGFEAEISQVILSLILNSAEAIAGAGKQGGAGGTSRASGRIILSTRRAGDVALLEVSDDGPGMSESVRQQVFEPFFSTKEVGQGTGQGLSIAWSIVVDKHRGSIEVESSEGVGSLFRVRLPLEQIDSREDSKSLESA